MGTLGKYLATLSGNGMCRCFTFDKSFDFCRRQRMDEKVEVEDLIHKYDLLHTERPIVWHFR